MGMAIEITKAFMDAKGMPYDEVDDGALLVSIGGLKNIKSARVIIFFDDDDKSVAIRQIGIGSVPQDKMAAMHKTCSIINSKMRWVKFYADKGNGKISAEEDAVIQLASCGEEIFELVLRMANIVDQVYPDLMKVIWC